MKLDDGARDGHYARKQLLSSARIIAWSHGARYRAGLELAAALRARRLLDYGCGDGTFLAMLLERPGRPTEAVGAELSPSAAEDCRSRLGARPGLSFVTTDVLAGPAFANRFDAVICMDVLEHVVDVDEVLVRFETLLAPGGALVVSVPVETGLAVLLKQAVRRVAGWRGVGDYPGTSPYTLRESWRSVFAGARQHIARPIHQTPHGPAHDHKGFNWRVLDRRLRARFEIERTTTSPISLLPPGLSSQVWFVARRRG
jgi:SAM-dependent methyltransferase